MKRLPSRLAWIALVGAGCSGVHATLPAAPGVSFAAHRDGEELVVDRVPEGGAPVLARPGRVRPPGAPDLVLRADGETRGALWIVGHSRVLVRDAASTIAPRAGEVLSTWDGGAIRLVLYTRDARTLRTDVFARADALERSPPPLSRDVRGAEGPSPGTYRADIRDAGDTPVGWMRVQIGGREDGPRIYDAVLPPGVDGALAAAAAIALDEEITWIAGHGAPAP